MDVTWIGMLAAMGGSSTPVNTWVFLASAVALYAMGICEAAELISYVADSLSTHKRPREIRFVNELPRNAMGKVQKSLLVD